MFRVKWPRAPWAVTGGGEAPGKVAMTPTPEGDGSDCRAPCAPVRSPHLRTTPHLELPHAPALKPASRYHPASHLGFHHSVQGARTPGHTPTFGAKSILGAPTESTEEGHTDYNWHPLPNNLCQAAKSPNPKDTPQHVTSSCPPTPSLVSMEA